MNEMAAGRYSQVERFLLSASQKPHQPFIVFQESPGNNDTITMTFREADHASSRLARFLLDECGAKPGDMIASLNENTPQFIVVMLACWKIGCAVAYQNYQQVGRVFSHSFEVSGAKILVFEPALYTRIADVKEVFVEKGTKLVCYTPLERPSVPFPFDHTYVTPAELDARYPDIAKAEIPREMRKDVLPTSVASLVYTSGSTGEEISGLLGRKPLNWPTPAHDLSPPHLHIGLPKAAILTHAKHASYYSIVTTGLALPTDRLYGVGPLFHANGGFAVHIACMLGIPVCITRRFSATRFFAFCSQTGVTMFPYVGVSISLRKATPPFC